ncbi:hypothetical protein PILCRDRAFT_85570 [Piloderma croceum F 1598]|uniref:Uncharacterized protein n=1 Tax=Piloderma croceum (strain F 1598) TaxID=765440 RepID=A0A0C3GCQ2_PILCF|nr:hypothetical protein PILCRDRAFT_85570 [Piloderma croceum F 1598]
MSTNTTSENPCPQNNTSLTTLSHRLRWRFPARLLSARRLLDVLTDSAQTNVMLLSVRILAISFVAHLTYSSNGQQLATLFSHSPRANENARSLGINPRVFSRPAIEVAQELRSSDTDEEMILISYIPNHHKESFMFVVDIAWTSCKAQDADKHCIYFGSRKMPMVDEPPMADEWLMVTKSV